MKSKKIILLISSLAIFLLVIIKYTNYSSLLKEIFGRQWMEIIFNTLIFTPLILFFSLLTYWLPQVIFNSWWKFARLAIPIVFVLVIIINLRPHSPGGWMNLDNEIDLLLVGVVYGLFTLGSLIQIIRGFYRKN